MQPVKLLLCILCDVVSLPLDIFKFSSFSYVCEARSYHWTFSKGRFNRCVIYFKPYSLSPRSLYSSDSHSFARLLQDLVWESFIIICLSSDLFVSLDKPQGPIYDPEPLPLQLLLLLLLLFIRIQLVIVMIYALKFEFH